MRSEGAAGIQWIIQHAWPKIDAEFALNEGGVIVETREGTKIFEEFRPPRKCRCECCVDWARGTAGQSFQAAG